MKNTKKSLLLSVVSMLLCFSMLLGTSWAWFTDSVSSGSNVIKSGKLDLDVQYTLDGKTWNDLDGADDLFQKGLWEPGHTEVVALKITNKGSLALKYEASMNIIKETIGKNKDGGNIVLSEILTVSTLTFAEAGVDPLFGFNIAERSIEEAFKGENNLAYNAPVAFKAGNVLQDDKQLLPGEAHYVVVKVDMPETVGNEANHDGKNAPKIEFGINVLATQSPYESDSFGNQYDKDATFEDLANTSIMATATKTLAAGANSLDFDLSYNGLKIAKVIVPASAIEDASKPVTVTFDGITPSQAAIVDDNTKAYAYDIDVTNLKDNLSGDQLITVVVTAPNALAAMKAYHNGTLIQDAVYDEVEGTITFKTANFSPYDFTYQEKQVATLEELRAAVKESNVEIKLTEDLDINLEAGSTDRSEDHKAKSTDGKTMWYNAVNIVGENVAIDLNGHKITVKCSDAHDGNQDVGALFFVDKEGSLNIIDRKGGGFIKMKSSIYMVWAPFNTPSYMDIYGGAFIADGYAGDPIGTPIDKDGNHDFANGSMKNENSNRALVYAGTGGNMNIYGGYFLYNNTPNDIKNRNNGAFNCTNGYEGDRPFITIHDGVYLIDKAYRQDPTYTSVFQNILKENPNAKPTDEGIMDNSSIKLAKDCEIAKTTLVSPVTIDGNRYSTWYKVIMGITSITATAKANVYDVGYTFTTDDFNVFAFSANGSSGVITNFTVSQVDTSTPGQKTVRITYTNENVSKFVDCAVEILALGTSSNTIKVPERKRVDNATLIWSYIGTGNFNVSGWANVLGGGSYDSYVGKTYTAPNGEVVKGFNNTINQSGSGSNRKYSYDEGYYDLTITNAKPYTTLGINCLVGATDSNNPIKGFGSYINDDLTTLQWNPPAIVHESGSWEATNYGTNNGHSLTTRTCDTLQPDETYTIKWVVIFEDGLVDLCQWTVTMAKSTSSDASFVDTTKPNANVIVMSGQSNMFGPAPLTQAILDKYASVDYSNVFIKYDNINFDVAPDGSIPGSLSTVFSNSEFQKYEVGIGAQGNTYFGPELALAYSLATNPKYAGQQWFIVKYAAAGTALGSQWTSNCSVNGKKTTLTADMLNYVQTALDEIADEGYDVHVRSFMWMQGESDAASQDSANNYAALEEQLVKTVRDNFAAYATRATNALNVAGSGISFINAGIASNDQKQPATNGNGPNDWIYAAEVNAGKISNSQWLCSLLGAATNDPVAEGPLKGYTFGLNIPTIVNPNQSGVITNSIYIDTHHLLSKAAAHSLNPGHALYEDYAADSDDVDWAHYSAGSMEALGQLYSSCLEYLILQNG